MTKLEAIRELREYDHAFLKPETVKKFTAPFGFEGTIYLAKANPHTFKGLYLYDDENNPIDEAWGQDAHIVACEIADHLRVDYPFMHGIGSQLRVACDVVEKYLLNSGEKE